MNVTNIEDRDFNFTKIWLNSLLSDLELIGNQKMKVANHIFENLNKENQYIGTQRQISERINVSLPVINETLKILMSADLIRKVSSGVYMVNPDKLFKGTHNSRLNVLKQYSTEERKPLTKAEKIANLKHILEVTQSQIDKLTQEQE